MEHFVKRSKQYEQWVRDFSIVRLFIDLFINSSDNNLFDSEKEKPKKHRVIRYYIIMYTEL